MRSDAFIQSIIAMATVAYVVVIAQAIILAILNGKQTGHGWKKTLKKYLKDGSIIWILCTIGIIGMWIIPFIE
ncbi:hypothetical protein A8L34_28110 [Bacillus sp. FJAT-27264]|uniref:hypothetical protein n=1 Tax=Paenibacillus sp. (strain DSM 101736 / FJAT-27264) TaxID=1850362 RepID=UPI0008081121|nr:hypothetical protein [Bacillus sp. FJAT-27264]OBZ15914.1 hypothetical protein A8L34_28110 [Bacillus sp. FJAT-27264]